MNYYPHDIEFHAQAAAPELKPGSVIAISCSDPENECEEQLHIICTGQNELTEERYLSLSQAISDTITKEFGISPSSILFTEKHHLSKTTSGKLRRQPVKQKYRDHSLPILYQYTIPVSSEEERPKLQKISLKTFSSLTLEEQLEFFYQIIKQFNQPFKPDAIEAETTLSDLGLSSIDQVHFLSKIEEALDIELNLQTFMNKPTLISLIHLIQNSKTVCNDSPIAQTELLTQPSFLKLGYFKILECIHWYSFHFSKIRYTWLFKPHKKHSGMLFKIVINTYPFFKLNAKQRTKFGINMFNNMEYSKSALLDIMRDKLFQPHKYFPYTYIQLKTFVHNCPKPAFLLLFHFSGWKQYLLILIQIILENPSFKLSVVADIRNPLFSHLQKEFSFYYGQNWNLIDPDRRIEFINTWDTHIAVKIKQALNENRLLVVFPDTLLANGGIGHPIPVPMFNDKIQISTGAVKIAALNEIPVYTISYYLSASGLHQTISKPFMLTAKDITPDTLERSICTILSPLLKTLEHNPVHWVNWLGVHSKNIPNNPDSEKIASTREGNNILELHRSNGEFSIRQYSKTDYSKEHYQEIKLHDLLEREQLDEVKSDKIELENPDQ